MTARSVAAPALAVAIATFAGGCGEKRETSTGGASSGLAPGTVSVSESEFKLTPSTVRVPSSGPVTIQVTNSGGIQHALVVEGPRGGVKTPTLSPGHGASLGADLKPGTYTMFCPIDGHRAKGMEGKLVVEAP